MPPRAACEIIPNQGSLKNEHVPSLDGLRAISIGLVLIGHLSGTRNLGPIPGIKFFGDIGHLGVIVFFVISGFLITELLMKEHHQTGRISLRLFYARRALRIFPACWTFIIVIWLSSRLELITLRPHDLTYAIAYLVNYKVDRSWYIGHLWSLSVEEQFYLLWPVALSVFGPYRSVWWSAALLVLGPASRILAWFFLRGTPYIDLEMFPMVADSLAAGCLLAVLRARLELQPLYLWLFRPLPCVAILGTVLTINRYLGYTVVNVLGGTTMNVLLAILIHRSVYCQRSSWGRFLESRPIVWVGLLSYSLYLWQQPFFTRGSSAWIASFPQNLFLSGSVALLSYFLIEKPLLRIRRCLRIVKV